MKISAFIEDNKRATAFLGQLGNLDSWMLILTVKKHALVSMGLCKTTYLWGTTVEVSLKREMYNKNSWFSSAWIGYHLSRSVLTCTLLMRSLLSGYIEFIAHVQTHNVFSRYTSSIANTLKTGWIQSLFSSMLTSVQ